MSVLAIIWLLGFAISAIQNYFSNLNLPAPAYLITFFIWPINIVFWIIAILNKFYEIYLWSMNEWFRRKGR